MKTYIGYKCGCFRIAETESTSAQNLADSGGVLYCTQRKQRKNRDGKSLRVPQIPKRNVIFG